KTGNFKKIDTARKAASYAGVCPFPNKSGKMEGKSKIVMPNCKVSLSGMRSRRCAGWRPSQSATGASEQWSLAALTRNALH
ncbi:MAG: transposase, partial [Candidatus Hydrogenedentota bacterium]